MSMLQTSCFLLCISVMRSNIKISVNKMQQLKLICPALVVLLMASFAVITASFALIAAQSEQS